MAQSDIILKSFATLVRNLITQYKNLQKENEELFAMVDKQDNEIKELKASLISQQKKYDMLMAAKIMNLTDADIEQSKKRISRMLRSVNQCITLLGEQNNND